MTAAPDPRVLDAVAVLVGERLAGPCRVPLVVGLCGAQGSGKTTLARATVARLEGQGIVAAALSIDDLYLTRAERAVLGREVHPLLATRGPPGTHDVPLGLALLAALENGEAAPLPRFDKAADDRAPRSAWPLAPAHCRVLVFEGWCVGAVAQAGEALVAPVNALEAGEDPDGRWRRAVNTALAGPYAALFARLDALVLLAAPGFEAVHGWRLQQEEELRRSSPRAGAALMDAAGIARFIQYYERLTRHILAEMPVRADLVIRLGPDRAPLAIERRT